MQRVKDGKPRLIQCGSSALTPTQQRYATVELECLGIQWAVKKCDFHLRGLPHFEVHTDHKPLEGIFRKGISEMDNARLMRMREKLVMYNFKVIWVPGHSHEIADALIQKSSFRHISSRPIGCPNIPTQLLRISVELGSKHLIRTELVVTFRLCAFALVRIRFRVVSRRQ